MIYERYGNYIEGLAEEAWGIREYFGVDCLAAEIKGHGPQAAQWITALLVDLAAVGGGRKWRMENPWLHFGPILKGW